MSGNPDAEAGRANDGSAGGIDAADRPSHASIYREGVGGEKGEAAIYIGVERLQGVLRTERRGAGFVRVQETAAHNDARRDKHFGAGAAKDRAARKISRAAIDAIRDRRVLETDRQSPADAAGPRGPVGHRQIAQNLHDRRDGDAAWMIARA